MKKLLLICAVMLGFATSVSAQDNKMAAGVQLNVGFGDSYTNVGLGARYQYTLPKNFRVEGSFDYFFKKDGLSMWDINVDAHYVFKIGDNGWRLYPLVGLTILHQKVGSWDDTDFGANYGGGCEYQFSDSWKAFTELKGQSAGGNTRGIFTLGAAYCF